MPEFVKSIEVIGLFNRFDIKQVFQPGINIFYGRNGAYKTTLLHILANALNGDYERFINLEFNSIEIQINDGVTISIKWQLGGEKIVVSRSDRRRRIIQEIRRRQYLEAKDESTNTNFLNYKAILPTDYFPAFRTMIEAWISLEERENTSLLSLEGYNQINKDRERVTFLARKLFGDFIPKINYLSLFEIEEKLIEEIREATLTTAQVDRRLLSQSFVEIFSGLLPESNRVLEKPEALLKDIKLLSQKVQKYPFQEGSMLATEIDNNLRDILDKIQLNDADSKENAIHILAIYRNLLEEIVNAQEKAFFEIERYLAAVNSFLEGKKIEVSIQDNELYNPVIKLTFDNGDSLNGIQFLSSGERQIITLMYAAYMSFQKIILIDEPEISLHVDWQELLLPEMSKHLQDRQIIACTHSPMIGANYEDRLMEINLTPTDENLWIFEDFNNIEYPKDEQAGDEEILDN